MSLGNDNDWQLLLVAWSVCLLAAVSAFGLLSKSTSSRNAVASALVFSGGLGNLLDRLTHGAVIDFINVNVAGFRTAIFNVADILIIIGFLVLLSSVVLERKSVAHRRAGQNA
jgi:signal peptidase II